MPTDPRGNKGHHLWLPFPLAPVVQTEDSAIHRINLYPLDSAIGSPNIYAVDRAIHLLNNWGKLLQLLNDW